MSELFQKVNWIDLLVVILLIRSSYVGFTKGFGWEFFRVIAVICAAIGAIYFYENGARLISDYIPVLYPLANQISFTSLYLIILLIIKIITLFIDKIIKLEVFSALDMIGGLVLGAGRGVILLSLLLITLMWTPIPYFEKSIQERSLTGQTISAAAPFIYEKIAVMFPALKYEHRNEELLKLTRLEGGTPILQKTKKGAAGPGRMRKEIR